MRDFLTPPRKGKVSLVGAGPGDPELLTLKALRAIERADVAVYDRLVGREILALIPPRARSVDVGKRTGRHNLQQGEINDLLIGLARRGQNVARIKGGDPTIFGRGGEEALALRAEGIEVQIIPGITAAQGAAAAAGIPLTHRGMATSLRFVTGHRAQDAMLDLDWPSLAAGDTTLAVYMGVASIIEIANELMHHGLPGALPVLAIANATTPLERRLCSTLATLGGDLHHSGMNAPVLFIIGQVAGLYPGDLSMDIVTEVAAHV